MSAPRFSLADAFFIALGGMLGSLLRAWIGDGYTGQFPVPTILINILGAAALGLLHATRHRIHPHGRYLYMVGFCGSFTTVSLFSLETIELATSGHLFLAALNILLPITFAIITLCWILNQLDQETEASRE